MPQASNFYTLLGKQFTDAEVQKNVAACGCPIVDKDGEPWVEPADLAGSPISAVELTSKVPVHTAHTAHTAWRSWVARHATTGNPIQGGGWCMCRGVQVCVCVWGGGGGSNALVACARGTQAVCWGSWSVALSHGMVLIQNGWCGVVLCTCVPTGWCACVHATAWHSMAWQVSSSTYGKCRY